MPDKATLLKRAEHAVELSKKAGAADAWAVAKQQRSVDTEYRDGKLEKVQESTAQKLSVRLYVSGRYSTHETTDLRPVSLRSFIAQAVALTRHIEKDPYRTIPDAALFKDRPRVNLGIVDEKVSRISPNDRLAWCRELYRATRGSDKIISSTVGVYDSASRMAAASSNGFSGTRDATSLWMGGEVTLRGEGGKRPEGYYYAGGTGFEHVPNRQALGKLALREATRRLGAIKGPTKRATMIVEARAAGRLLSQLLGAASAYHFSQDRSFWKNAMGKAVVSKKLSITDEPLLRGGSGSRHFDDEGISARSLPIIDKGVLTNIYVDTYYGKKIDMAPTTGARSNWVLPIGNRSYEQLVNDAGSGVIVSSWLGGNADATTGDFSFGVRGHLVEQGEVTKPVGEMNVTGNLLKLFGKLVALGNDPWPYGPTRAPTLIFEDVQFSGA